MSLKEGIDFKSSNIQEIDYRHDTKLLYLTYKVSNRTYVYEGVDQDTIDDLLQFKSKGRFINLYIKPYHRYKETTKD